MGTSIEKVQDPREGNTTTMTGVARAILGNPFALISVIVAGALAMWSAYGIGELTELNNDDVGSSGSEDEHVHKFFTTGTATEKDGNVYVIYRCECGAEQLVYLAPASAFD